MKPSEGLEKTLEVLYDRGWTKHRFERKTGEVCLRGATRLVMCGTTYLGSAVCYNSILDAYILQAIRTSHITTRDSITHWNDAPGRTFDDIVEVLELAKKLALIDEEGGE